MRTLLSARSAEDEGLRWEAAFLAAHQLLATFCPRPEPAIALLDRLKRHGVASFGDPQAVERYLSRRHRAQAAHLQALLATAADAPGSAPARDAALSPCALRSIAAELVRLEEEGELARGISTIAGSFVHMAINRRITAQHRLHELTLADALLRIHRRARARDPARRDRPLDEARDP